MGAAIFRGIVGDNNSRQPPAEARVGGLQNQPLTLSYCLKLFDEFERTELPKLLKTQEPTQ